MPQANLPSGDYFMQEIQNLRNQMNALASTRPILTKTSFQPGAFNTSSLTPVTIAGVTVPINFGVSGDAVITYAATVFINSATQYATIQVYIDGVQIEGGIVIGSSASSITASGSTTVQLSAVLQTVTPGLHTCRLEYFSNNGGNVSLTNVSLTVNPI